MVRNIAVIVLLVCCFGRGTTREARIIGGNECCIQIFPFQAYLQDSETPFDGCGATIIHENWALTAAHCVENYVSKKASLYLKSSVTNTEEPGNIHHISEIIIHPTYDSKTYDFDAALLKVIEPFGQNTLERPIKMAQIKPPSGAKLILSGWGKTNFSEGPVKKLQCVKLHLIPLCECKNMYKHGPHKPTSNMLCAGDVRGRKDVGNGDAGSGLATTDKKYVVGIVSWWTGAGKPRKPPVFTDVSVIRPWVISIIRPKATTKIA